MYTILYIEYTKLKKKKIHNSVYLFYTIFHRKHTILFIQLNNFTKNVNYFSMNVHNFVHLTYIIIQKIVHNFVGSIYTNLWIK